MEPRSRISPLPATVCLCSAPASSASAGLASQGIRLRGRRSLRSVWQHVFTGRGQSRAQAGDARRFRPGHRVFYGVRHDVQAIGQLLKDRSPRLCLSSMPSPALARPTGHGCVGYRCPDWRIAKGAHDSARPQLPGGQPARVGPHGRDYNPRYYFDLRKERKNAARANRPTLLSRADCCHGSCAGVHRRSGRRNLVEGRKKLVDNAETCAAMTRAAATAMG